MPTKTLTVTDSRAGLICEVECEIAGQSLTVNLWGRESGLGVSEFAKSFDFDLPYLERKLRRLIHRIDSPDRCRDLERRKWPARPFAWMRRHCCFVGSLRASPSLRPCKGSRGKRMLSLALVPRKGRKVVEVCVDDLELETIHLPLPFFSKLESMLGG